MLALSVLVAHVGPIAGIRFFDGGVMAVETFYILSGFYMAMILSTRYAGRTRDFYFNRFIRLYPLYWMLLIALLAVSGLYWLLVGHPLGGLAAWDRPQPALYRLWAVISNGAIFGTDAAKLFSRSLALGNGPDRLILIEQVWTIGVELIFYLLAPLLIRQAVSVQFLIFTLALLLRILIWNAVGGHWSIWLYLFAPATWVFFAAGVMAYHAMSYLQPREWFQRYARTIGVVALPVLVLLIAFYTRQDVLGFQDWRYYLLVTLSAPFLFTAFKSSWGDNALAAFSYPMYLAHSVVQDLFSPTRHFVSADMRAVLVLIGTIGLTLVVLWCDLRVQRRFKRRVGVAAGT